ncbi:MAG: MGMT family protein [Moraxellaceae bacterium]|nr:MGMT family protein [Moraxellaceae bacterium]
MGEKQQAILMALNAIPEGHVTSYGEVARRAGLPGYARMVCRVLRELPDRSTTPWWRVIRADGRFGMDEDCSVGREQRQRLRAEGVNMTASKVTGPWWQA